MIHGYLVVAVVGNRTGWAYQDVQRYLNKYLQIYHDKKFVIISGGAAGVDSHAERYCYEKNIPFQKILPIEHVKSPDRFFIRNGSIAALCDVMLAFNKKKISGTAQTMHTAKNLNKEVVEIDG